MIHDNIGMKEKGFSDEQIQRKNIRVRRNKKIREDQAHGRLKIIWGADDETLYSFEERKREDDGVPPKKYTVFSYNKERYNIVLQFPKMPIVFLGNKEWYPIEFLYQSFGKMKAANTPEHVKAVLDYYNTHAGTKYIGNVTEMFNKACNRMSAIGLNYDQILQQYNLRKKSDPVELEARVLEEPTLKFSDYSAFLKDGDWGVMKGGTGSRFKK